MRTCNRLCNNNGEMIFIEKYTANNARANIVFCHGITGCRKGRTMEDSYFQVLASKLEEKGYNCILFDYSGHGESEGSDYDVCLSKSISELELVMNNEVDFSLPIHFVAFSYGAAVLNNYLNQHNEIQPLSMVLYSPCLFPNNSCFLTEKSVFGKDVYKEYISGDMEKNGYAVVGVKGFKLGINMIHECKTFIPDAIARYSNRVLAISGKNDVILDTSYNMQFFNERNIRNEWLSASHSLFEEIDKAFELTISFITDHDD